MIFLGTSTTFAASLFNVSNTLKNDPGTSVGFAPYVGFTLNTSFQADTLDQYQFGQYSFWERASFEGINGGTFREQTWQQYRTSNLLLGNAKTGAIIYNRYAFYNEQPNLAGTFPTRGIIHNNFGWWSGNQDVGRDFNYAWYSATGILRAGDDIEVDSLGTKGLILHPTVDTRYRYIAKAYTGALQSAEVAFSPFVDIDWYMATDASSANVNSVADGADIVRWNDKSGNGRDLTQGTGTDVPIYETVRASLNSQPAVEFTAANSQSLEYATTSQPALSILASTGYTIVAVVDFKTVAAVQRVFTNVQNNTTRGMGITATPRWTTQQATTTVGASVPATATKYLMRWYITSTAHTLYINEVSEVAVATTGQNLTVILVGAARSAALAYGSWFDGYIAFFGIYSGDLSTHPQYSRLIEYFNTTYGFTMTTTSVAQGTNTHSLVTSVNTTTVGNVGIGEDDLRTYSLPASFLSTDGDSCYFEAAGTIASSANAKRIRVKFGATTIFDTGAAGIPVSTAIDWRIMGRVVRTGAATQKCMVHMNTNSATLASYTDYTTAAETLSGAVTLKLTAEAVADNDIVQEIMLAGVDGT